MTVTDIPDVPDLARMRRERDSIAQQRDALRGRIAKVMDDQRQMLDEASSQATYTSMKHNEPVGPPPAAPAISAPIMDRSTRR